MCSIMAAEGAKLSYEDFCEAFARSKERGPDLTRVETAGDCLLGFHRLTIMGLSDEGMQPFERKGDKVVCNGELYGFRRVKKKLEEEGVSFAGESDCEIILPLYRECGTDMFAKLDAEFAMVLHDSEKKTLVAARDPIGIRPLFYGHPKGGGILFASEARCLVGLVEEIFPFPPGCYYEGGRFTRYTDIAAADPAAYLRADEEEMTAEIRRRLERAVEKRLDSDVPLGFLLSGGLDSSLVCAIAQKLQPEKPIRTFAVGMDTDAIDLKYARQVADYIGSDHTEVIITKDDVLKALPTVVRRDATYDITTIRASVGMHLVCQYIHEQTDIRVLLTGEVSDELFGYKYTDFAPSPEAFQTEAQKRVRELYMYDVLRADRCISDNSLEGRVPFGDLAFVTYVMHITPEKKVNTYGKGKYLLRKAFSPKKGEKPLLPEDILWREKAAFSDAVGHSMVDDLKAYAEAKYTDEEFKEKRKRYAYHAEPFTKESLCYRELFETYYPGQARMIRDFWMPNRDWEGCDVDDPSARVLANYGASGE